MAEIAVPAVITAVFSPQVEKLISKALRYLGKSKVNKERRELEEELKLLALKVKIIRDYLEDAESKQFKSAAVRTWLNELTDIAYDAEDLLDEYVTDAALLQIRKCTSKAEKFMNKIYKSRPSSSDHSTVPIKVNCKNILVKIKDINKKFKMLAETKEELGLRKLETQTEAYQCRPRGAESTSLLSSQVIGRDVVTKQIVNLLTSDGAKLSTTELPLLPIVGMGGVGKTTLAQLVFHDDHVKKHFDLRIWVWVSQDFDPLNILKHIISDIEGHAHNLESLQNVCKKVRTAVENKKFLLMLDDAWNEDYHLWEQVIRPLASSNKGSTVVVTTRSHLVAKSIRGHIDPIHLKGLDDESLWNILEYSAFGCPANPSKHEHLIKLGRQIIEKLKGSPLAAKAIGGLLNADLGIDHWNRILTSEIWELDGQSEHGILPSLMLSYQHLSPSLKQCFQLCSLFLKGCEFASKKEHYIRSYNRFAYIAMAHDIFQVKSDRSPEDCARDALHDLLSRSLFQEDKHGFLTMHDLIHDVSEQVAQEDHLHIMNGVYPKKYPNKLRYEKLRTLLVEDCEYRSSDYLNVLDVWFHRSTCLRVMDLSWCQIDNLPSSVSNLKHLRYLNLSNTSISELPKSLTSLYNLQFLDLSFCRNLSGLPETIGNLLHLRYLGLSGLPILKFPESLTSLSNLQVLRAYFGNLSMLPNGITNLVNLKILDAPSEAIQTIERIGRMTSLQELREFQVDRTNGWEIEQLENLNMLRGALEIKSLENVADEDEAKKAHLQKKVFLRRVRLRWSENSSSDGQAEEGVLEALQPSGNHLEYLAIQRYKGRVFPSWLIHGSHFPKLKEIRLSHWENCIDIPTKFPSSLLDLYVEHFPLLSNLMLQHIPTTLKRLYIYGSGIEDESLKTCLSHVTSLRELSLKNCPKLLEPLEKEVVLCCMQKSLKKLELGGGNWGFYFNFEEEHDSAWHLRIEKANISFQEAAPAQRWGWDLLLGIASKVQKLIIANCDIKSMDVGFQELFHVTTTLNELSIQRCEQLLSLPSCTGELTTLQELCLFDCPKIQSLADVAQPSSLCALDKMPSIPDTSLPASVQRLSISSSGSLRSLPSDMDTSLKSLQLQKCFEMKTMLGVCLPASLQRLYILDCECFTLLPSDMRGMTSLRKLVIHNCKNITSLPTSGLPAASLGDLHITECPALKERYCRESGGPEWELLSHIPNIRWERIYK